MQQLWESEARDVASDSHKAALEGWSQNRKGHADLQDRKMRADEEAAVQSSLLEATKKLSLTLEKQVEGLVAKVNAGGLGPGAWGAG